MALDRAAGAQFRVIEKDARIDQASWGGYIRHNQLWREVYGLSGALLEEQYLCANDAIMMYSPLLSAAPADGVIRRRQQCTIRMSGRRNSSTAPTALSPM